MSFMLLQQVLWDKLAWSQFISSFYFDFGKLPQKL